MSKLLEKANEESVIKGLEVGKNKMVISHLHFADDTIFFFKLEVENIRWISKILHFFCSMSGLYLNWDKSSLLGINMEQQRVKMLAIQLGANMKIGQSNTL